MPKDEEQLAAASPDGAADKGALREKERKRRCLLIVGGVACGAVVLGAVLAGVLVGALGFGLGADESIPAIRPPLEASAPSVVVTGQTGTSQSSSGRLLQSDDCGGMTPEAIICR